MERGRRGKRGRGIISVRRKGDSQTYEEGEGKAGRWGKRKKGGRKGKMIRRRTGDRQVLIM